MFIFKVLKNDFRFSDILEFTLSQADCDDGINRLNKENSNFYKNTLNC